MSCRNATDSYLWRIPKRVCVKERTYLVKYRSNFWHNLFNNEACQKALNLWNQKWSLAPTKPKTVKNKHMDIQYDDIVLKTVSSRCLRFYAKIVCKGIMNWHFKTLLSEITSVCRTILRFFNILALQQRNLDMQVRFMPRYSLPT